MIYSCITLYIARQCIFYTALLCTISTLKGLFSSLEQYFFLLSIQPFGVFRRTFISVLLGDLNKEVPPNG